MNEFKPVEKSFIPPSDETITPLKTKEVLRSEVENVEQVSKKILKLKRGSNKYTPVPRPQPNSLEKGLDVLVKEAKKSSVRSPSYNISVKELRLHQRQQTRQVQSLSFSYRDRKSSVPLLEVKEWMQLVNDLNRTSNVKIIVNKNNKLEVVERERTKGKGASSKEAFREILHQLERLFTEDRVSLNQLKTILDGIAQSPWGMGVIKNDRIMGNEVELLTKQISNKQQLMRSQISRMLKESFEMQEVEAKNEGKDFIFPNDKKIEDLLNYIELNIDNWKQEDRNVVLTQPVKGVPCNLCFCRESGEVYILTDQLLGKGLRSEVKVAIAFKGIKKVACLNSTDSVKYKYEINKELNNYNVSNVVQTYDSIDNHEQHLVFSELLSGKSVQKSLGSLDPMDKEVIIRNLLTSIKEMHEQKFTHGDISIENVVVSRKDRQTQSCLFDFDNSLNFIGGRPGAITSHASRDLQDIGRFIFSVLYGHEEDIKPVLNEPGSLTIKAREWAEKRGGQARKSFEEIGNLDDLWITLINSNSKMNITAAQALEVFEHVKYLDDTLLY